MAYRLVCIKSCISLNVVNPHFPNGTPYGILTSTIYYVMVYGNHSVGRGEQNEE